MRYRLFQYPLPAPPELEDLNSHLASHRIAAVSHHIVPTPGGAMLLFIVQGVASEGTASERRSEARVDYREVLSPEDFEVFRRLRDERKKIAEADSVPVYTVFTNAQLAAMVTRRVSTPAELGAIEGIGAARVEKHAARLIEILTAKPT